MEQKVTVTLKRFYFKEVEMEIDNELIKGMSHEQIGDYLVEEHYYHNLENVFKQSEMKVLPKSYLLHPIDATDRYDIYEDNNQVYGGHL
tara:strand:- start:1128 stop:1394 length:267 start_codon:yes stop_codon:yes gene_type:complete